MGRSAHSDGKKNTTVVKQYGRVSETPCFPGENSQENSPQIVNCYGDSELIRRSMFNAAGSFGKVTLEGSEVSKRGWRTEGVGARKSFLCTPFSYASCRRSGTHMRGNNFCCILAPVLRPSRVKFA